MKLDARVYEALTYLRGNPHFELFIRDGLSEYVKYYTGRCVASDGTVQSRAAGAVEALRGLETDILNAPKTLEKLRSITPKNG